MSGSLNHVIGDDGNLTFDLLGGMKDAGMAISQMYDIIVVLSHGNMGKVSWACEQLGFVDPYRDDRYDDEPMPKQMKLQIRSQ